MSRPVPDSADEVFDEKEESRRWAILYFPFLVYGFLRGVELGTAQGSGKIKPEDLFTAGVRQAIMQKSYAHAALAVGTTRDELQALIRKAIDEGQGVQELAKAIRDQFDVDSRVRSLRIARTELSDTINDGVLGTLVLEGFPGKTWSTVVDGRDRTTHHDANGQTVDIHGHFLVGGHLCTRPLDESLPASEKIMCRCNLVGAGIPKEAARTHGLRFLRVHGSLENRFVISLDRAFSDQRRRVLSHFPSLT